MNWNTGLAKLAQLSLGAAALVVASVGIAAAIPSQVVSNVNLRQGPGTNFGVVATIPRGAMVEVLNCTGEWCNVLWQGRAGFAVARNLNLASAAPVGVLPPPLVVAPAPIVVAPYYWGPRPYYYGGRGYWGPRYGWRRW